MSTDLALLPVTWETVRLSIKDITLDEVALLTSHPQRRKPCPITP